MTFNLLFWGQRGHSGPPPPPIMWEMVSTFPGNHPVVLISTFWFHALCTVLNNYLTDTGYLYRRYNCGMGWKILYCLVFIENRPNWVSPLAQVLFQKSVCDNSDIKECLGDKMMKIQLNLFFSLTISYSVINHHLMQKGKRLVYLVWLLCNLVLSKTLSVTQHWILPVVNRELQLALF